MKYNMKLCKVNFNGVTVRVLYQNYAEQTGKKHFPYYRLDDLTILLNHSHEDIIKNCKDVIETNAGTFISTNDLVDKFTNLDIPHEDKLQFMDILIGIIQGITICIATHDTSVRF